MYMYMFFFFFNSKKSFPISLLHVFYSHIFWSRSTYVIYENPYWCNGKPFYPDLAEVEKNPPILINKIFYMV